MVPIFYFDILHSKSVILLGLCLVFVGFITLFPQWFKDEIFNEAGKLFLYILVTIYVCLNVKPLKESTYFLCETIPQLRLTSTWKKQPHQEVEYGYICK